MVEPPPADGSARKQPPRKRHRQYDGPGLARALGEMNSGAGSGPGEVARRFGLSRRMINSIRRGKVRTDLQPLIRAHRKRMDARLLVAAYAVGEKKVRQLLDRARTGRPGERRRAREILITALMRDDMTGVIG